MPLVPAVLADEITKITDKTRGDFVGFPLVLVEGVLDIAATNDKVATNWSTAFGVYAATISAPAVLPPVVIAAVAAFKAAMFALLGPPGAPTAAAALPAGFVAGAAVLAAGAIPPSTAVPPPGAPPPPPPLPALDPAIPAAAFAASVHGWLLTGQFIPSPGATPLPWS